MPGAHEIVLVRHGETEWSRSGRHTSRTDVALTERGREQARALAGFGAEAEVTDDLAEWDYGAYEGITTAEIRERVPGWTIFAAGAPGGESAARVGARWIGLAPEQGRLLGLDVATVCVLGYEREQRVLLHWNA